MSSNQTLLQVRLRRENRYPQYTSLRQRHMSNPQRKRGLWDLLQCDLFADWGLAAFVKASELRGTKVCVCVCVSTSLQEFFCRGVCSVCGIERLHQTDLTSVHCLCSYPPDMSSLAAQNTNIHTHTRICPPFSPSATSPYKCISSRRPSSLPTSPCSPVA